MALKLAAAKQMPKSNVSFSFYSNSLCARILEEWFNWKINTQNLQRKQKDEFPTN